VDRAARSSAAGTAGPRAVGGAYTLARRPHFPYPPWNRRGAGIPRGEATLPFFRSLDCGHGPEHTANPAGYSGRALRGSAGFAELPRPSQALGYYFPLLCPVHHIRQSTDQPVARQTPFGRL